jgi:hypothetical protein
MCISMELYLSANDDELCVSITLFDHIFIESRPAIMMLYRLVIGVLLIASTSSFLAPNAKQSPDHVHPMWGNSDTIDCTH